MEKIEDVAVLAEKQLILNRIIAAGLNSLSHSVNVASGPDKELLETFVSRDFVQILPCWPMLNEQIKFFIFKTHISSFEKFMKGEERGDV